MFDAVDVLSKGLSATRLRVNTIASNIANAQTTNTPEGGPYKPRYVHQVAQGVANQFTSALDRATLSSPKVLAVVTDNNEPKKVFQPGHPDADAQGYVAYPNINIVEAMTDLMSASRLYEANVSALQAARNMGRSALQISIRF